MQGKGQGRQAQRKGKATKCRGKGKAALLSKTFDNGHTPLSEGTNKVPAKFKRKGKAVPYPQQRPHKSVRGRHQGGQGAAAGGQEATRQALPKAVACCHRYHTHQPKDTGVTQMFDLHKAAPKTQRRKQLDHTELECAKKADTHPRAPQN